MANVMPLVFLSEHTKRLQRQRKTLEEARADIQWGKPDQVPKLSKLHMPYVNLSVAI